MAKRAVTAGHVVDIFACALDQVLPPPSASRRRGDNLTPAAPLPSPRCPRLSGRLPDLPSLFVSPHRSASLRCALCREVWRLRCDVRVFRGEHLQAVVQGGVRARRAREYLRMCFGGTLEVLTSSEFKVCGAIGNVNSHLRRSRLRSARLRLARGTRARGRWARSTRTRLSLCTLK